MKRMTTVSVGVPAYNEAKNIENTLRSIIKQSGDFTIKKITVVCDGCTDNTAQIVKKFSKKYPIVRLIDDGMRHGKAARLNQIYQHNSSKYLFTFDADVVLKTEHEMQLMIEELHTDAKTHVVTGLPYPVAPKTLMARFSYVSYLTLINAAIALNQGSNYYTFHGCASLLTREFARHFSYPQGVISDQNYLFTIVTRSYPFGARLAKNTRILFRSVSTFNDWRVLSARSVHADKANLISFFGNSVMKNYHMPVSRYMLSTLNWFIKDPIGTIGSVGMNIFVRIFPLKNVAHSDGTWDIINTSKEAIIQ